ncbi:uncharacterized protein DSM5745_09415 [Aspergillus mulundensis]|uniref:Uncharacterized protein n=1 Tax=Aspergillus mulundensis TaxID=1810919 RepID=A0A3D8QV05_9EURO|nr:hypothetical protein DSM5745_09415 [Aspergillus mulundensis]RDW65676.1 hypothetical protein DSM5745_09415 [Aspergillus mulundensis]
MEPYMLYSDSECMRCGVVKPTCLSRHACMIVSKEDHMDKPDSNTSISMDSISGAFTSLSSSSRVSPGPTPEDIAIADRKMLDKLTEDLAEVRSKIQKTSKDIARQERIIKVTLEQQKFEKDLLSRPPGGDMPWEALVSLESVERREAKLALDLDNATGLKRQLENGLCCMEEELEILEKVFRDFEERCSP